jgi:hypothetical protein
VFVKGKAAKEKLRPALSEGDLNKTMAAPVMAIALGVDRGSMPGFEQCQVRCGVLSRRQVEIQLPVQPGLRRSGVRPRNPRLSFDEACRIE